MGSGLCQNGTFNGVVSHDVTELVEGELIFTDVFELFSVAIAVGLLHFAETHDHFLYLNQHAQSKVQIMFEEVENL